MEIAELDRLNRSWGMSGLDIRWVRMLPVDMRACLRTEYLFGGLYCQWSAVGCVMTK